MITPQQLHGNWENWPQTIDTEPGWHPLIQQLDQQLHQLTPGYTIQQIKQKYGTLRYYAQPPQNTPPHTTTQFHKLIQQTEQQSAHTCETCGQPATTQKTKNWYHTHCPQHQP